MFPTLIPLGLAATELRERQAPPHLYRAAIAELDAEIDRLKLVHPHLFRNEDEENDDAEND